jgi:hypothetical protein
VNTERAEFDRPSIEDADKYVAAFEEMAHDLTA